MISDSERVLDLIKERIAFNQSGKAEVVTFTPFQTPDRGARNVIDSSRSAWSLQEMLAYYDRQFVRNAYLVLLKRDPDVAGLTSRLESLHSGAMTRVEMLFRLRYGSEGKAYKVHVRGLVKAFAVERICAVPILGVIPRMLRAIVYLPRMQSDIQEVKALLAMQKNDSDDRLESLIEFQNAEFSKRAKSSSRKNTQ